VFTLVLTGAGTDLGHRVAVRARAGGADVHPVTASDPDLKSALEGADVVVHLGGSVDDARQLLDAAGSASVPQLVVLSSATVYGAWANNAVPLTEAVPLRPNPDFEPAVEAGEVERLVSEWRDEHPAARVAVLRATTAVAEGYDSLLARGLRAAAAPRAAEEEPAAQFIHLDDLAAAIELAAREHLDGAYNVAPDGWIQGEEVRALAGGPRVRLPERVGARLTTLRWRLGLAPTPPGLLPYVTHPWVVANDRLRAAGWEPTYSNEEAFVAGHRPGPLATLSPRRRQELALGAAGVGVIGMLAGVIALVRYLAGRSVRVTTAERIESSRT